MKFQNYIYITMVYRDFPESWQTTTAVETDEVGGHTRKARGCIIPIIVLGGWFVHIISVHSIHSSSQFVYAQFCARDRLLK